MTEEEKTASEKQPAQAPPDEIQAEQPSSTDKAFGDYESILLKTNIPQDYTLLKNSLIDYRSNRSTRRNKRCFLIKAEESANFYQRLSNHITLFAKQDSDEIRDNVTDYIAQNTGLANKITDALKALKTAKEKILVLKDKAYKLDEARKNSAFSDAVAALDRPFPGSKGALAKEIEKLKNDAEHCYNLSDDAVEVAVKVAGIRASANVENLQTMSMQLADKVGKLNADVSADIIDARGLQTAAQTEYDQALKNLSKFKYGKYEKTLGYEATLDTTSQTHDPECAELDQLAIKLKLDTLASTVEGNFIDNNQC